MKIPKIIHYCWMSGDEYPEDIKRCIDSWKKHMPDFTFKLWNSGNFDVNMTQYTREAFDAKKYAFVSDYIRLYALYHEGGIYLDIDIEVFKSFEPLLDQDAFTGFESGRRVAAWIFGSKRNNPLFRELLDHYTGRRFQNDDGQMDMTPNTVPVTKTLIEHGLQQQDEVQNLDQITIYPTDYFCPKNPWSGKVSITDRTYALHHFKGAWNHLSGVDLPFIEKVPEYVHKFVQWLRENEKTKRPVVVYGAGTVGRIAVEELLSQAPEIDIQCVAVSNPDDLWTSICNIPIKPIEQIKDSISGVIVLIATTKKYQDKIKETVTVYGVEDYFALG